ncbi:MAG: hypothetical protein HQ591_03365 [candidate division Zixibacteria bacterium]|nr:hypothetical protein [Candidatus Tariuqbacter arcticus]
MTSLNKYAVSLLLLLLFTAPTSAQPPDTLWMRTYVDGSTSVGYDVRQTDDDGFIATGMTHYSTQPGDVYLVKTDPYGDVEWTRTYDWNIWSVGYSVRQTDDGGYIIAGYICINAPSSEIYLIKTDDQGDTLWTKVYGTDNYDIAEEIQQTTDGGYIIAGSIEDDVNYVSSAFLLKTDANGDSVWMRIDDDRNCQAHSVIQNSEGDYLITGGSEVEAPNYWDAYIMKTDVFGDTIWIKYYGGTFYEYANFIRETIDGGYFIGGITGSYGAGNFDIYLVRTDASGDTLWTKTYGGEESDYGESVDVTDDGGFVIAGMTNSFGNHNFYLIRTDSSGDSLWTKVIYGEENDWAYSVQQTTDGGFIVGGGSDSFSTTGGPNMLLIRLKPEYIPPISDLTISVSGNNVVLNWQEIIAADGYRIYRSNVPYFDIQGMFPYAVTYTNTFVDSNAVGEKFFYRVTVVY